ncbi:hypothetical protein [Candidatus Nitrotoga sp. 1052]|uniref:hypothetical protein n=1 Tax=Candidatus Nitrotoga sp. 1052 TaxID=2886964 RepID=UPI001EF48C62|nr:hypothetical protein [Candidatus Nitrotoga sp. 1052]CAH1085545.1 hypothetical protein NTG1052_540038 [Candidatus Nitrotoga sp. 1052]
MAIFAERGAYRLAVAAGERRTVCGWRGEQGLRVLSVDSSEAAMNKAGTGKVG